MSEYKKYISLASHYECMGEYRKAEFYWLRVVRATYENDENNWAKSRLNQCREMLRVIRCV